MKLNPLDAAWLAVESRDTPMHVGSLLVFSKPAGAGADYLQQLMAWLRGSRDFAPPWNLKLRPGAFKRFLPVWESEPDVDLEYHLRHSALPAPGGERELGMLVSRLHSHPLDFSRPLWECNLIEGLAGDRFALYTKMHHSLVDGIGGIRMLQRAMAHDPELSDRPPPWSAHVLTDDDSAAREPSAGGALRHLLRAARGQAASMPEMLRALRHLYADAERAGLTAPFAAPRSVLNARITGQRRFATQQYDMARIKALARVGEASFNDVVLWLCATGLRRLLKELQVLPKRSLTVGIPVNVRPAGQIAVGNAITFILADLATATADPRRRLERIKTSTAGAKANLRSLPKAALTGYTVLVMAPFILELLTGLGGRTRPIFNITISNVPGSPEPLYLRGARLEAMYPLSLVAHGQALNITCLSYAGTLNFGFTACRDCLPHMQRLAVYCGEALDELEAVLGARRVRAAKARSRGRSKPTQPR
ncbi:MAG: wax ester/triacylglycerol synthase family O-acyltransferase [Gammaproteobacteria bacterium]|nr:wax ester/triacylglycerol synthase family O-acyltransferase [Gammaproteobacteria bacterium]